MKTSGTIMAEVTAIVTITVTRAGKEMKFDRRGG